MSMAAKIPLKEHENPRKDASDGRQNGRWKMAAKV